MQRLWKSFCDAEAKPETKILIGDPLATTQPQIEGLGHGPLSIEGLQCHCRVSTLLYQLPVALQICGYFPPHAVTGASKGMGPGANGKTGLPAPISQVVATTVTGASIIGDFVMFKTGGGELLMNGKVKLGKLILIR